MNAHLLWNCWHKPGMVQLKRGGSEFLFTKKKKIHGAEIWSEYKQLHPSSADHRLDGGRALRSTLVIDVFDRLLLGIFPFLV